MNSEFLSKKSSTPIVKIAKTFDFKVYKKILPKDISGGIFINGRTKDKYG